MSNHCSNIFVTITCNPFFIYYFDTKFDHELPMDSILTYPAYLMVFVVIFLLRQRPRTLPRVHFWWHHMSQSCWSISVCRSPSRTLPHVHFSWRHVSLSYSATSLGHLEESDTGQGSPACSRNATSSDHRFPEIFKRL